MPRKAARAAAAAASPPRKARAAAAAPARAMLLTDLSLDEISAVIGEIGEAEDIARTASV